MTENQIQFEVTEDYQIRMAIPDALKGLAGFVQAVAANDAEAAGVFLREDARVKELMSGAGILSMASFLGNAETVALMIDHGADINETIDGGWTPLLRAARMGDAEMVRLLVEKGADINAAIVGLTVLMMAVVADSAECVQLLIDNHVDIGMSTDSGVTAQILAEKNNRPEILQLLNEYAGRPHARALENQQKLRKQASKPVIIRGPQP